MAHEITSTDNFFAVRQPGWHGLGVTLPEYPTREEAQSLAHPWEPVSTPLFVREVSVGDDGELQEGFREVQTHVANVRSDNGETIGVVGEGYVNVQNNELWDVAEALQGEDAGDVRFETAGSLMGGRKVWILVRLNDPLMVKGDPNGATIPYFALQNAHDGSGAFRGQATMTRIVCANTSKIADLDAKARGTEFTFRHSKNIGQRIEQAKQALSGWKQSLEEWQLMNEHLMTLTLDRSDVTEFIERFIPEPHAELVSDRVRENVAEERRKLRGIFNSATMEGIDQTAYGLVNASIEYAEHFRKAQTEETRFKRAYLDNNRLVSLATKLALEVAR